MEQLNDLQTMLDQLDCPAFLAQNGQIAAINIGAKQRMAEPGVKIEDLLLTGKDEYKSYTDGCLHVTLRLGAVEYACTITKLQAYELFSLEETSISAELQALALAASQLRMPLAELTLTVNKLQAQNHDHISALNQSISRLQRIVGNMSDASTFASAVPRKETQEMCGLFQSVLEKAQTLLSHSGHHILYHLPEPPIYSLADSDMLTRAVYNLLSNACKFAVPSNPIEVTLKKSGNKLYLTVCDNGQGVESNLRSTMFTRYKRQPGIEDPRHGLGLGMAMVHAAASTHGGTVLIQHTDQGTQTTMSLAIEKPSGSAVRSPVLRPDYYGGQDQALIELSEVLPKKLYNKKDF